MPQQNEFKTTVFVRGIPPEVYRKAKSLAVLQGKTLGRYIAEALVYLNGISEGNKIGQDAPKSKSER